MDESNPLKLINMDSYQSLLEDDVEEIVVFARGKNWEVAIDYRDDFQ